MLIYLAMIDSPEGKPKFEIIYNTYKQLMYYTASSILGDTTDSEDIVHEAFLKIIEILEKIDKPDSPQTRSLIVTILRIRQLTCIENEKNIVLFHLKKNTWVYQSSQKLTRLRIRS